MPYSKLGGGESGPAYYQTVQEDGTPVTQRDALNFAGDGLVVTDDSGSNRTNVELSTNLKQFTNYSTAGLVAYTGSGWAGRTLTSANSAITVTNGNGASANPIITAGALAQAIEAATGTGLLYKNGTSTYAIATLNAGGICRANSGSSLAFASPTAADQIFVSSSTTAAAYASPRQFLARAAKLGSTVTWNNTTTFTEITDLTMSLPASSGQWYFEAYFIFDSGITPDFKVCPTVSTGSGAWFYNGSTLGTASNTMDVTTPTISSRLNGQGAGISQAQMMSGYLSTTLAVTLKFWGAQMTANASDTKLTAGWVVCKPIVMTNAQGS